MSTRYEPPRLYHDKNSESMLNRSGIIKRIVNAPHSRDIRPTDLLKLVRSGVWRTAGNHPRSHPRDA